MSLKISWVLLYWICPTSYEVCSSLHCSLRSDNVLLVINVRQLLEIRTLVQKSHYNGQITILEK